MKNQLQLQKGFSPNSNNIQKEIKPTLYGSQLKKILINGETEKTLNAKIFKTTKKIANKFPELSIFLAELEATIPDKKNKETTLRNLRVYNNSLNSIVDKYMPKPSEVGINF